MRKRGWSIQSDQTGDSSKLSQDEGDGDDDDLNQEEKKQLLNNFPTTEHDDEQEDPVVKRPRIQDETESKDDLIKVAQHKLSKWAARLFDPDRPRGLIEAPRTIPLNDEFLTAFGQREKEFDTKIGRSIDIQEEIENDDDASSDDEDLFAPDPEDANKESVEERKVRHLLQKNLWMMPYPSRPLISIYDRSRLPISRIRRRKPRWKQHAPCLVLSKL